MYYNRIKTVESGAFDTLYNLETLKLQFNELNFSSNTSVHNDIFNDLQNLVYLDISTNNRSKTNYISTRNELFTKFSKLQSLSIDLPEGAQFATTNNYSWLLSVENLIIRGGIQFVSNTTFAIFNQSNVVYLNINSNILKDVEPMAFSHFPKLHTLNVSFNMRLSFENISKAWYGLRFTSIRRLDLTCISPYDKQIIHIQPSFFNNLDQLNITDLYLSHNDIFSIRGEVVNMLPSIKRIWLSNNHLQFVEYLVFQIAQMKNLVYFDANFQVLLAVQKREVKYGPTNDTKCVGKVAVPYINANKLLQPIANNSVDDQKQEQASEEIYDSYNVNPSSWTRTVPLPLARCLKELHVSQTWNRNVFRSPSFFFLGRGNLRFINYSNNFFDEWHGSIYFAIPPRHKITLDLSNHLSKHLHPDVLKYSCQYFDKLFLANNRLGSHLGKDGNGEIFGSCHELTLLDLSNNDINFLPVNFFRNLSQLKYLNLSSNSLRVIHMSIAHMTNLLYLDLYSNMVQYFDEKFREVVNSLTTKIDLSENPLVCDCQTAQFIFWIERQSDKFSKFKKYSCLFQAEVKSQYSLTPFRFLSTRIVPQLAVECSSKDWLKYSIIGLLAITLIFCIAIFTYRHRWEIKFCLLQFNYRKRNYIRLLQQQEELRYEYAAFVSYDSEDRDWVENNIVRELETAECRLFLYRSEFQLGQPIEANIMRALNVSRKTILVLSPRFVTSQWCLFEARMAFQKCIDTGIDSIIPIILEPINNKDMPTEVKRYLTDYIYLQWPQNSTDEQREFWDKLRRELDTLHYHLAPSQIISDNHASRTCCC